MKSRSSKQELKFPDLVGCESGLGARKVSKPFNGGGDLGAIRQESGERSHEDLLLLPNILNVFQPLTYIYTSTITFRGGRNSRTVGSAFLDGRT